MIRYLTRDDIPQYQKLITTVWQETYPGIVNQQFLDHLSQTEEQRIELNNMIYDENIKDTLVLEIDDNIIGFVRYGTTEDILYPNTGEIFALYILSKYKRHGYGKQLVQAAIKELLKQEMIKILDKMSDTLQQNKQVSLSGYIIWLQQQDREVAETIFSCMEILKGNKEHKKKELEKEIDICDSFLKNRMLFYNGGKL